LAFLSFSNTKKEEKEKKEKKMHKIGLSNNKMLNYDMDGQARNNY